MEDEDETPKFLREGTYGCAHKPALKCTPRSQGNRKINYKHSISKLGEKAELINEYKKYQLLDEVDPKFKYHLSGTILCDPSISGSNEFAIESCKMGDSVLEESEEYKLMILKDGGKDLDMFLKKVESMTNPQEKRTAIIKLWKQCRGLFYGVRHFLDNGIVHHDIKTVNIVYNEKTNQLKYIDFGLTEEIEDEIEKCKMNRYDFAVPWFYYPIESILLYKKVYERLKNQDDSKKKRFIDKYLNPETNSWITNFRYFTYHPDWDSFWNKARGEFEDFVLNDIESLSHDDFLDLYFQRLDSYSLGVAMSYLLKKTGDVFDESKRGRLANLILGMTHFNILERVSIDEAIREFENIIGSSGGRMLLATGGGTDPIDALMTRVLYQDPPRTGHHDMTQRILYQDPGRKHSHRRHKNRRVNGGGRHSRRRREKRYK